MTHHRAKCGSAAGVRGVCGKAPSAASAWDAFPAEERGRIYAAAEGAMRRDGLTIHAAERAHGIPKGYLRRRLKYRRDRAPVRAGA